MKNNKLKIMVTVALLAAFSFMLMYIKVPLVPYVPFLTYDLSEVICMLGAFILGPVAGIFIVIIKAILYFILGPKDGGWVGALASMILGLSLVLGTVFFIRKNINMKNRVLAVIIGTAITTTIMTLLNYFIFFPLYGIGQSEFSPLILNSVITFNVIKGLFSTIIAVSILSVLKNKINKRLNLN